MLGKATSLALQLSGGSRLEMLSLSETISGLFETFVQSAFPSKWGAGVDHYSHYLDLPLLQLFAAQKERTKCEVC